MAEKSKSIYQISRLNANMTQEDAAPCVGVDMYTLSRYENKEDGEAPDDAVKLMMTVYRDTFLGFQHALHNPVAKQFLPKVIRRPLSQAACQLYSAITKYVIVQSDMMDIAKDDKVEKDEREKLESVNEAVSGIIKAAYEWKFAVPDGEKK